MYACSCSELEKGCDSHAGHKRRIRWDEELGDQENRHPGQQLPEATKRPVLMGWVCPLKRLL